MYELTVRASDGNLVSTLDVEVTVTDVNESGVITGLSSVDYAENATTIVATYSATDPDERRRDMERRGHGCGAFLNQYVGGANLPIIAGL